MLPYHLLHGPSYRETIISVAKKEVGVREEPKNSNLGERVEMYQRSVGEYAVGKPWCSCFAYWVCQAAATKYNASTSIRRSGRAISHWYYAPGDNNVFFHVDEDKLVQPGDLFIQVAQHRRLEDVQERTIATAAGHIGFVTSTPDKQGWFTTIEGNTNPAGHREGGGVYARNRHLSECIVGFVRPRLAL